MRAVVLLLTVILLTGCMSGRVAFHVLNAVDVAQTESSVVNGDCHEISTVSRNTIGEEPSKWGVLAFGAAISITYEAIRAFVPERWLPVYDWASVATRIYYVAGNQSRGCGL